MGHDKKQESNEIWHTCVKTKSVIKQCKEQDKME